MRKDAARAGGAVPELDAVEEPPVEFPEPPVHTAPAREDWRGSYDPNVRSARSGLRTERDETYAGQGYRASRASHPGAALTTPAERTYAAAPDVRQPGYGHEDVATSAYYADSTPDPHADAYADPAYDPAQVYDDLSYEDEPAAVEPRRRSGVMIAAAVLGVAAIGTAGAFGYRALSGSGGATQPPVIKANAEPNKVAPAAQSRDSSGRAIYDRPDGSQAERMVSREEQPVELREARSAAPRASGSTGGISALIGASGQPSAALAPVPGAPAATGNPNEPKRVKTIPIRPDGSIGSAQNSGASGRNAAAQPTGRTPGRAAPMELAPQGNDPLRAQANQPTRTASIPPAVAAPASAGSHVVQVASQKSEEDAQASFRSLQAKYPDVLAGRQPLIRRIELGDRGTFYRVQVGPFGSAEAANDLCGNLKAAGGQCIVQRN
jgi:hypothetical protein